MSNLFKAIAAAKSEIQPLTKDSTNPFFNSKYFDINSLLANVEPILTKHGLLVLQPLKRGEVTTQIVHVESGESIDSSVELPSISDPQKTGSCITYFRRYTLSSLLGLQAEDDDANKASQKVGDKTEKPNQDDDKQWFNVGKPEWTKALKLKMPLTEVRKFYKVSKANAAQYEEELKKQ